MFFVYFLLLPFFTSFPTSFLVLPHHSVIPLTLHSPFFVFTPPEKIHLPFLFILVHLFLFYILHSILSFFLFFQEFKIHNPIIFPKVQSFPFLFLFVTIKNIFIYKICLVLFFLSFFFFIHSFEKTLNTFENNIIPNCINQIQALRANNFKRGREREIVKTASLLLLGLLVESVSNFTSLQFFP